MGTVYQPLDELCIIEGMEILFITAGIIMLASLSGLVFLAKNFSGWLHNNAKFIIAFSSGIFAVVTYDLFNETIALTGSWLIAVVLGLVGFLIFSLFERLLPEIHHHESDGHSCTHSKYKVIWGDALHNIGDGILLAASFSVDVRLGLIAAFGIFIHEFVQEISEFSVLRLSGMSIKKAIFVNMLVASTIFIGVILGLYIADIEAVAAVLFGISAGVFLHLVATDLVPQSIQHSHRDKNYFTYLLLVVAGILTIVGVNAIGGGHENLHSHGEHGDHTHSVKDIDHKEGGVR